MIDTYWVKNNWIYAAIALLGVTLATPGLRDMPFTQGDDATYYATARSLKLLLDWGWENSVSAGAAAVDVAAFKARYEAAGVEFAMPYYSKPLFDVIYLGALELWGIRPQAILFVNLVFFAIAIWSLARIGEAQWSRDVGLLAALLLATSGSALVYARTGMAHMASLTLFLLGAHLFLRMGTGDTRRLWAPGAVWGLCLAVHPNLLPFIGICGVADMGRAWRMYGPALAWRRALILAAGAAAVGLAIEGGYRVFGLVFQGVFAAAADWWTIPFRTYFEQLTIHVDAVQSGTVPPLQKIYTYLLLFWAHEGLLVCALIGLATAWALKERCDPAVLLLVALFWLPLIYFMASKNLAVYRYAAPVILPGVLLAALALERLLQLLRQRWPQSRPQALAVAIFAVAAVNIAHLQPIYQAESAWASTAQWLRLHNQRDIVSTAGRTLWAAHGIGFRDPRHGVEDVRYLALYKRYEKERELAIIDRRASTTRPIFTAEHRRPDKLLEIAFLVDNPVLDGLGILPGIGEFVANMRMKVLELNELHYMEVYELRGTAEGERAGPGSSLAREAKRLG